MRARLIAPVSGTCLSYWSYQAIIPSWTVGIFALGRMDQSLPCLYHIIDCRVTTDEERNMERGMGGFGSSLEVVSGFLFHLSLL